MSTDFILGYHERVSRKLGFWFKSACIVVESGLGITDAIMMYTDVTPRRRRCHRVDARFHFLLLCIVFWCRLPSFEHSNIGGSTLKEASSKSNHLSMVKLLSWSRRGLLSRQTYRCLSHLGGRG